MAAAADWTIVIAPESAGQLEEQCQTVLAAGGRLLGPSLASIRLAADKQATAEHLQAYSVPVPAGRIFQPQAAWLDTFAFPAVVKPGDGAGSQDIVLVHSAAEGGLGA